MGPEPTFRLNAKWAESNEQLTDIYLAKADYRHHRISFWEYKSQMTLLTI